MADGGLTTMQPSDVIGAGLQLLAEPPPLRESCPLDTRRQTIPACGRGDTLEVRAVIYDMPVTIQRGGTFLTRADL